MSLHCWYRYLFLSIARTLTTRFSDDLSNIVWTLDHRNICLICFSCLQYVDGIFHLPLSYKACQYDKMFGLFSCRLNTLFKEIMNHSCFLGSFIFHFYCAVFFFMFCSENNLLTFWKMLWVWSDGSLRCHNFFPVCSSILFSAVWGQKSDVLIDVFGNMGLICIQSMDKF